MSLQHILAYFRLPVESRPITEIATLNQTRNAYRAALILTVVIVPTIPFYLFLGLASGVWQLLIISVSISAQGLFAVMSVIYCRRGQSRRGITFLLDSLAVTLVLNSLFLAEFGLVCGLLVVILSVVIGTQSLPAEAVPRLVIFSGVLSLIAGLLDLAKLPTQYLVPGLSTFILIVIGVVLLIYCVLIIRQFKSYPLRSKMIFVFLIISLTPLILLGLISYHNLISFQYSAEEYVRSILMIGLIIVGVVGVTSSYIAQLLAGPLTRLTHIALRVGEGDLNVRAPIESADEIGTLAATFNDMTARLQQTMDGLAQHVEELKQVQEQLKTYSAELERSNRDLQDFAWVASHDLNEPLRKIKVFSNRLLTRHTEDLNPQARDYLNRMQNATTRMQTLIDNLLTYSRVTTRGEPFCRVDLSDIMHNVLLDLEIRIEQSRARVDVGNLPVLEADPTQMRQLMQNLLSNALKFHRDDVPPRVRIEGEIISNGNHDARYAVCRISVSDNGIGIEEEYLDRVFHLFQRLNSRSTYEGTGIGLAICRRIVERHDGMIVVRSTPGQGSTFIITLPLRQASST